MADPGTLGATAWYDPSDAGGTTLSGSDVTNLVDLSGNGRDTVGSGSNPTLTGTINGLDAIEFNGTNDWLGDGPLYTDLFTHSAWTVAGVIRFDTIGTSNLNFDDNDAAFSDLGGDLNLFAKSTGQLGIGQWDGGRKQISVSYTPTEDVVFVAWLESGQLNLVVNGVTATPVACGNGVWAAGNTLRFGRASSSANYANVAMGEWASFNTALSSTDRNALIAYLRAKWVPVPFGFITEVDLSASFTVSAADPPPSPTQPDSGTGALNQGDSNCIFEYAPRWPDFMALLFPELKDDPLGETASKVKQAIAILEQRDRDLEDHLRNRPCCDCATG